MSSMQQPMRRHKERRHLKIFLAPQAAMDAEGRSLVEAYERLLRRRPRRVKVVLTVLASATMPSGPGPICCWPF